MSDSVPPPALHEIVVDRVLPHAVDVVWRTVTTPALIERWLKMAPIGFAPVIGTRFTYQTTPAGEWDGVIRCTVLDVIPGRRLVYSWTGGHPGNVGYGAPLDTIVTLTLDPAEGGTRLRIVHAGFVLPANDTAYRNMSGGWSDVVRRIADIADD